LLLALMIMAIVVLEVAAAAAAAAGDGLVFYAAEGSGSGSGSGNSSSGSGSQSGGEGSASGIVDDDGVLTVMTVNLLAGAFLFLLFCLLRRSYRDFYHPRHRFRGTAAYAFSSSTKASIASASIPTTVVPIKSNPSPMTQFTGAWNATNSSSNSNTSAGGSAASLISSQSSQHQHLLQEEEFVSQSPSIHHQRQQAPPSSPFIPRQREDSLVLDDDDEGAFDYNRVEPQEVSNNTNNTNANIDNIDINNVDHSHEDQDEIQFEAASTTTALVPPKTASVPSSPRETFVSYSSFAPTSPSEAPSELDRASYAYTASEPSSYSSSHHRTHPQPTVYTSLLNQHRDEGLFAIIIASILIS